MEGEEERSENEGSFSKASIPKRIAIVVAGATVNIVFGLLVYFILMSTSNTYVTNQINSTIDGYAAQEIGLQQNDKIIELNGKKIKNKDDINKVMQNANGSEMHLKIERNEKIIEYVKNIINIFSGIFDVFVSIIVSVYILLQRSSIVRFLRRFARAIFKKNTYEAVNKYFTKANEVFFTFISSQLLDAVIVGILTTVAMLIIKVKYAPLIGFTIGLFNMIPYIGAIVAVAIGVLITFITGGFGKALAMAIVVTILQQIDANIINPKIIGDSLEISPLLVIFSVTVGGAYFGILGMFLAVPIAVVIRSVLNDWIDNKNKIRDEEEKGLAEEAEKIK